MGIIFTPHAKARIKQRNIGKSVIFQTIQNPDDIVSDEKGTSYIKKFGKKTLKVPYINRGNDIIVKSVFYIEK